MIRRAALGALLLVAGCVTPKPPQDVRTLQRAEEHFLRGEHGQAVGLYELYLADNPGDPSRAAILAQVGKCRLGEGRGDLAIKSFDLALSAGPAAPLRWEITFRRALALRGMGDNGRALDGFRATASAPAAERGGGIQSDEFNYEFAITLFRIGDWKGGHERLAAVSPRGPFGAQAQARHGLTAFTVQVAAFADAGHARAEELRLKSKLLPCAVRAVSGDRPLHVVSTGAFARYEDAQREADRLRRTGFPAAFVIP